VSDIVLARRWSPAQEGPCALWVDSYVKRGLFTDVAQTSPVVNSGDTIAAALDVGIGGKTATQSSASLRPAYAPTAINSRPSFTTDGVDDFLQTPAILASSGTIYVVWKPISVPTTYASPLSQKVGSTSSAVGGMICVYNFISGLYTVMASDATAWSVVFDAGGIANGTATLWSWSWGTTLGSVDFRKDRSAGTVFSSSGTFAQPTSNPFFFGCGYGTTRGSLAVGEALVFTTQHSLAKRQRIETYLSRKWGTP